MGWWPGWNSIAGTDWWSNFFFWLSISGLVVLGVSEVVSHRYTIRKDDLVSEQQTATERRHDEEVARLHLEASQLAADAEASRAEIAKANERASAANLRLEEFRQEEWKRRQPRRIPDDKKDAFVSEIRGKIPAVTVIAARDHEARVFEISIEIALSDAGVTIHSLPPKLSPALPTSLDESVFSTPSMGVLMYSPNSTSQDAAALKDDPLYKALIAAGIFGGSFVAHAIYADVNPGEYAIFVPSKPPW